MEINGLMALYHLRVLDGAGALDVEAHRPGPSLAQAFRVSRSVGRSAAIVLATGSPALFSCLGDGLARRILLDLTKARGRGEPYSSFAELARRVEAPRGEVYRAALRLRSADAVIVERGRVKTTPRFDVLAQRLWIART